VKEVYTGTKFQGRKGLEKILQKVQAGDTIIFDSVSRMSRDAEEGFQLYEELFNRKVSRKSRISTQILIEMP
jgi:DNA invertase Pin-like site-specific DNA recombinase